MSEPLPKHTIKRDGLTSVWQLFNEADEQISAYTTYSMGHGGGVFCIKTGKGWTREMADRAFRAYLGELR